MGSTSRDGGVPGLARRWVAPTNYACGAGTARVAQFPSPLCRPLDNKRPVTDTRAGCYAACPPGVSGTVEQRIVHCSVRAQGVIEQKLSDVPNRTES